MLFTETNQQNTARQYTNWLLRNTERHYVNDAEMDDTSLALQRHRKARHAQSENAIPTEQSSRQPSKPNKADR